MYFQTRQIYSHIYISNQGEMPSCAGFPFPVCTNGIAKGRVQKMEIFCLPKRANPALLCLRPPCTLEKRFT